MNFAGEETALAKAHRAKRSGRNRKLQKAAQKLRGFFLHIVMPEQTPKLLHTPNLFGFGGSRGVVVTSGNDVFDPLVWPVLVVVVGDCFTDPADLIFANQDETIHNRPNLSHEPFNERVCLGSFGRSKHGFYAVVAQNMLERLESAVAIMNEVLAGYSG